MGDDAIRATGSTGSMDGNDESDGEDDSGSKTRRMTCEYTTKATRTMRTNCRETRVLVIEEDMDELVIRTPSIWLASGLTVEIGCVPSGPRISLR